MFAIFLSDKMDPLYSALLAFPTVIFSGLMVFCIFYWLFAVIGLVDLDLPGLDTDVDMDLDVDVDAEGLSNLDVLAGVMLKFGLNGVPFVISFSSFVFLSWTTSVLISFYLYPIIPDGIIQIAVNIALFIAIPICIGFLTGRILAPLRPLFIAANSESEKILQGQVAVVRTARVDSNFGEASYEDGGAGIIAKVRAYEGKEFKRGDRVVLLDHNKEKNTWLVISEEEFHS